MNGYCAEQATPYNYNAAMQPLNVGPERPWHSVSHRTLNIILNKCKAFSD